MTPFFVADDAEGEPCVWRRSLDIVRDDSAVLRKLSLPDDLWQLIVDAIKAPADVPHDRGVCEFCSCNIGQAPDGVWLHDEADHSHAASPVSAASAVTEQGEALPTEAEKNGALLAFGAKVERQRIAALLEEHFQSGWHSGCGGCLSLLSDLRPRRCCLRTGHGGGHAFMDHVQEPVGACLVVRSASLSESVPEETPNHEH